MIALTRSCAGALALSIVMVPLLQAASGCGSQVAAPAVSSTTSHPSGTLPPAEQEYAGEVTSDEFDHSDGGVVEQAEQGELVMRNFEVAPGEFAELNLRMEAGAFVVVTFRARLPVQWDVHSHPTTESSTGPVMHQSGEAPHGEVPFTAEAAGGYSYLWKNSGDQPVSLVVSVELRDGTQIESWHPVR